MINFYIVLIAAVIAGSITGYIAGFVRLFLFMVKILTAVFVSCILLLPAANMLSESMPFIAEWSLPVAFAAVFICTFTVVHLLIRFLQEHAGPLHAKVLNSALGLASGLIIGILLVVFIVKSTAVADIPKEIDDAMRSTQLNAAIDSGTVFLKDGLSLSQQQRVKVMSLKMVDSTVESGVQLPYVTNHYSVRPILETQMLSLVNSERKKYNLPLLIADTALMYAARIHSADMFSRGYFSHNTPEGTDPFQRLHKLHITYLFAGENLAMAPTVAKAHGALMLSPGHRANILHPSYRRVGIGVIDAGAHGLMITQEFSN